MNSLLKLLNKYNYEIKFFGKVFGLIFGSNMAWFIVLPFVFTYEKPIFPIIQHMPIVTMGLIVLWVIRKAIKDSKQQFPNEVKHE